MATREAVEQKQATLKWGVGRFMLLFLLLVGSEVLFMSRRDWLEQEQSWVLLAVSFGTTLLAFAVYQKTHSFSWFAVVAFLGVSAVQGVAAHYEITTVPQVEPAAVLIGGVKPVKGVFVAQTDDRIYLGVSPPARWLGSPHHLLPFRATRFEASQSGSSPRRAPRNRERRPRPRSQASWRSFSARSCPRRARQKRSRRHPPANDGRGGSRMASCTPSVRSAGSASPSGSGPRPSAPRFRE